MKKVKKGASILLSGLLVFSNFSAVHAAAPAAKNDRINSLAQTIKAKTLLQSPDKNLYIDPAIHLNSEKSENVIVELKTDPIVKQGIRNKSFNKVNAELEIKKSHDKIKDQITKKNLHAKIKTTYDTVFNGMAMEIKSSELPKLIDSDEVVAVYKNHKIEPIPNEKDSANKASNTDPMAFLGVNQVWSAGFTGKGMKIGVIDTGIDYKHPDLKNAYKGGYDFVDQDKDPYEGNSEVTSVHGTHVSGIIAGRGNPKAGGMKGVAPQSDLYVYRVLGPQGGYDEWVIAGIEKAVKDGMDVINLSLGAPVNDADTATSRAVNNAMLADVITVVANGNYGNGRNLGTVTSPAGAPLPISVGASYLPINSYQYKAATRASTDKKYQLNWMLESEPGNLKEFYRDSEVVYVGLGTEADFKKVNVKGKIALAKRGVMVFDDMNKLAQQAGAKALIAFNADGLNENINRPFPVIGTLPMFDMRGDDGRELAAVVEAARSKSSFIRLIDVTRDTYPGDDIADFSSNGPVKDTWDIKPDVVAPGVSIYSTVPSLNGDYSHSYARMSGTSMATPMVAGISALMKQAHPTYHSFDIKALLMNTSKKLDTSIFTQGPYSVLETGSGRVQPLKALTDEIVAEVPETALLTKDPLGGTSPEQVEYHTASLNFGDIWGSADKTKTISIKNSSSNPVTYKLSYEMKYFTNEVPDEENPTPTLAGGGEPRLVFDTKNITIPAKSEKEIQVTLKPDEAGADGRYEGFVYLAPDGRNVPKLQVPFAAFKNAKIFPGVSSFALYQFLSPNGDGIKDTTTIDYSLNTKMNEGYFFALNHDTGEIGLIKDIQTDELTKGDHHFTWNGSYQPIDDQGNLLEEKTAISGLYSIYFASTDQYGNDTYKNKLAVVESDKTQILLDDNKSHDITVSSSDWMGSITGTKIVYIVKNWMFSDNALFNMIKIKYEIKQDGKVVSAESPDLQARYETKDENMDFAIQNIPPGTSTLTVTVADKAGNENTETFTLHYDKSTSVEANDVELGKEMKVALNANQVKDYLSGEFELGYDNSVFTYVKAEPSQEFLKKFPNAVVSADNNGNTLSIKVDGKSLATGLDGNIPVANVYFNTSPEVSALGQKTFHVTKAAYTSPAGSQALMSTEKTMEVFTSPAELTGKLKLEAFLDKNGQPRTDVVYGGDGTRIKVYNSATNQELLALDGYRKDFGWEFGYDGSYLIGGLKPGETYDIELLAPGHVSAWIKNVYVAKTDANGKALPVSLLELPVVLQTAGDTNGDNKVDFYDRMVINRYLNDKTENGYYPDWMADKADINRDGMVNSLDAQFVKKNDGVQGEQKDVYVGQNETLLQLVPDKAAPQPGDIIEIKAFISHAAYTYGLQSIINYDPSVLQLVGKDGTPVTSGNAGDYFATDLAPIDTIKNNAGANTIEYTASFVGDVTKDPKDEGTVVTYYFKWINDKAISTTLTPSLKTVDIYGTLYQSKVESLELKIK